MKNPFKSKTMLLNAAALALSVGSTYSSALPAIDPGVQLGVLAVANLLLRLVTHQPLDLPSVVSDLLRRR
jgi:hypothetical protein